MERHKVRVKAVVQRQGYLLPNLQTKFDKQRQEQSNRKSRVMMELTAVPSKTDQYQSVTKRKSQ